MYCHVTCGFTCPPAFCFLGGSLAPLLTPPSSCESSVLLFRLTLSCLALGESVLLLTNESNTYSQCTEGISHSKEWQMAGRRYKTDSEHQPFLPTKCEILVIIHLGLSASSVQDSIQAAIWTEPASVQQANSELTYT